MPWSPVPHPGLDVFGKEGHSATSAVLLGLALQIHKFCCTTVPVLWVLEQPRSLFSDSGRSCGSLKPLLGAQHLSVSGSCLDVFSPSCLGKGALLGRAELPQHLCQGTGGNGRGGGSWAKLSRVRGFQ